MKSAITSPNLCDHGFMTDANKQESLRSVHSDTNVAEAALVTFNTAATAAVAEDDGSEIEDYEKYADDIVDEIWSIYKDGNGWFEELKSRDKFDVVVSKPYPKWGKVFRLSTTVKGPYSDIVEMLFERQQDIPKWSPTVIDCRILEVINDDLYVTYQMTAEQAQGFISKRDFVNLTIRRFVNDVAVLAAQACHYSKMPPVDNCVRGENGPTAYVLEKLDDETCKFTWLLNVDLKGWIPQYLINSSLASVQIGLVASLREYLSEYADKKSSGL